MNTIGIETAALTLGRFSLFFACRKYLLRTLYSDLKSLSSTSTPGTPKPSHTPSSSAILFDSRSLHDDSSAIELDALPPPSTHTPRSPFKKMAVEDTAFIHGSISRLIFSWCFAESCMLFVLLMLQVMETFSPSSRLLNWWISLYSLMASILVIIPLSISLLIALRTSDTLSPLTLLRPRLILSIILVSLYLFLFSYIPLPSSLNLSSLDWTEATLSRLIVLGTIVLGLLSGFGAVSSSWKFLPFGKADDTIPTERDIDAAQYALTSIRNDIQQRRAEASRRTGTDDGSSWFSRVGSSFRGGDSLTQELSGLSALEYQMSRNFEALRDKYEHARFSRTLKGRLWIFGGRLFMVYCILRGCSSIYNILFLNSQRKSSTSYPDLISDMLAWVLEKVSPSSSSIVRKEDLARQISLFLVGIIIISSVRMVLRGVTSALHITSRNLAASLMLLVLAQIMGMYMISTLVQLRSSFPPLPSSHPSTSAPTPTDNLFTTIPAYELVGAALFDWSFVAAGLGSLVMRWGRERVDGVGMD